MPTSSALTRIAPTTALLILFGCGGGGQPSPNAGVDEPTATVPSGTGATAAAPTSTAATAAATVAPPTTTTASGDGSGGDKPPADGAKGTVRVTYLLHISFGPCRKLLKTYIRSAQGYDLLTQCRAPASSPGARPIEQREFDTTVYAKARLSPTLPQGPAFSSIALDQVKGAPPGTTRCHRSADGANTFCENAAGIITYSAFDGHKLKRPKRDANRWYVLEKYEAPSG